MVFGVVVEPMGRHSLGPGYGPMGGARRGSDTDRAVFAPRSNATSVALRQHHNQAFVPPPFHFPGSGSWVVLIRRKVGGWG